MGWRARAAALLGLAGVAALAGAGPDRADAAKKEFEGKKREVLWGAGQRHLELGVWCRDAGLVPQATAEFLKAVEDSEGKNPGAERVLALMRRLSDDFWKTRRDKPSKAMLATYDKKAKGVFSAFQKERLSLAKWASKKDLAQEAYGEFAAVVRGTDKPLSFDAQGRVTVDAGALPDDVSARMKAESVAINDKTWLRDEFLARLPDVKQVYEAEGDAVRVRCQKDVEQAASLLAVAQALLAYLEDEMGGHPTRRIQVFVFGDRKTYETYCDAADLAAHKAATGVADGATFTTILCAEGLDPETLTGVTLHEMSHLFMFGVTPVVMPSWYAEGYAETYGGTGTFTWDGKTLKAGGKMAASRLDPIRTDAGYIPFSELLDGDALALINKDKGKASRFYAESWALLRYLRTAAPKEVKERFATWEAQCRGAALGAEAGKPHGANAQPAAELFRATLGDLSTLEPAFRAWLGTL